MAMKGGATAQTKTKQKHAIILKYSGDPTFVFYI
jgi:hypothetical protein